MKSILTTLAFCAFGFTSVLADEKGPKATPIDISKAKFDTEKGKVTEPTVITSADELKKAVTDADLLKTLEKTDFTKVKLVLFLWSGSGGDRLTAGEDSGTIVFTYKMGLTDDLRRHRYLFSMPKDAKFKIVNAQ
jgi:hypothetical protein